MLASRAARFILRSATANIIILSLSTNTQREARKMKLECGTSKQQQQQQMIPEIALNTRLGSNCYKKRRRRRVGHCTSCCPSASSQPLTTITTATSITEMLLFHDCQTTTTSTTTPTMVARGCASRSRKQHNTSHNKHIAMGQIASATILLLILQLLLDFNPASNSLGHCAKLPDIYWNSSNPM